MHQLSVNKLCSLTYTSITHILYTHLLYYAMLGVPVYGIVENMAEISVSATSPIIRYTNTAGTDVTSEVLIKLVRLSE